MTTRSYHKKCRFFGIREIIQLSDESKNLDLIYVIALFVLYIFIFHTSDFGLKIAEKKIREVGWVEKGIPVFPALNRFKQVWCGANVEMPAGKCSLSSYASNAKDPIRIRRTIDFL